MNDFEAVRLMERIRAMFSKQFFDPLTFKYWSEDLIKSDLDAIDCEVAISVLARHGDKLSLAELFAEARVERKKRLERAAQRKAAETRKAIAAKATIDPLWERAGNETVPWIAGELANGRKVTEEAIDARRRARFDELRRGAAEVE